jgi:hypothetical protein
MRSALYHLSRGRIDKRPRYNTTQLPTVDAPWQDGSAPKIPDS